MAGCGVVFAPLGIWLAQRLPNAWLTVLFAGVLVFVALRILQQANRELDALGWADDRPSPPCQLDKMHGKLRWTAPCAHSIMLAGSMAGFLSGLLGVWGWFCDRSRATWIYQSRYQVHRGHIVGGDCHSIRRRCNSGGMAWADNLGPCLAIRYRGGCRNAGWQGASTRSNGATRSAIIRGVCAFCCSGIVD